MDFSNDRALLPLKCVHSTLLTGSNVEWTFFSNYSQILLIRNAQDRSLTASNQYFDCMS